MIESEPGIASTALGTTALNARLSGQYPRIHIVNELADSRTIDQPCSICPADTERDPTLDALDFAFDVLATRASFIRHSRLP